MLNTYDVYYDTYVNDELVDSYCPVWSSVRILEDDEAKSTASSTYTWDDVKEYKVFSNYNYGFIRRGKKRMIICGQKYYMEKTPNLTLKIVTRFEKTKCSIKEIMSNQDGDRAIQYLVERGLNVLDGLR